MKTTLTPLCIPATLYLTRIYQTTIQLQSDLLATIKFKDLDLTLLLPVCFRFIYTSTVCWCHCKYFYVRAFVV